MANNKLYLIKSMYFWKLIGTLVITWFVVMVTTNTIAETAVTSLNHRRRMIANITVIIGYIIQILCLIGIVGAVISNIWYPF